MNYLQQILRAHRVILASQSPRRAELLRSLDIAFTIAQPYSTDETIPDGMSKDAVPQYLACMKAKNYPYTIENQDIIITADTLVWCRNMFLGKPNTAEHARSMLQALSDCTHEVITGVCLRSTAKMHAFSASTMVTFAALHDFDIDYYLQKYRPYDKAGAYGIQEWLGHACIAGINGSYHNVMGLPLQMLYEKLVEFLVE